MSDDASSDDGASSDDEVWDGTVGPATGSTPVIADLVPRSRLVGFMAEPMSRSVPFRRSTVLMLVAFLGLGTLGYFYPPNGPTTAFPATSGGIPGTFTPVATTPTTHPTTTTTTSRPGGVETTTPTTTTTTRPSSTTSTTSTSAPVSSTTTTAPRGSTTTTTTPAPGTTTSTTAAP